MGNMILMYYPKYDPLAEVTTVGNRTVKGIFHPATYANNVLPPGAARFRQMWEQTKLPLWILYPGIYATVGCDSLWRDEFAQVVVPSILGMLQRKRQMHSRLRLPDGTITLPQRMKRGHGKPFHGVPFHGGQNTE
ncbi:uncharacterized protein LY79DRAFT_665744 [Colletotrichum navitas]|uniref:Uncharacterized protein n=1 Tax=Colletotrichum navitas TaxID=681940 RepID=A0AAD8VA01_9PEZI|nr:uncharacterized protein LY79DRAFT_665744 [Colletotrichum navitas]KAK1598564.1 hypothetical protein LY79DRAFT_665744 [Colletotrichum navitas]